MSDNFSRGFWRRAGQNTADRLSNAVFGDNWARPVKHIRAETASRKQRIAEQAQLDSIHSAVLSNADSVRNVEFESSINELSEQLYDMAIQLKAEGWKSVIGVNNDNDNQGEINRAHNKFTDTLFAKYKHGLTLLERKYPFCHDVWYFKWVRYISGWRKFFGKYWFLLFLVCGFLIPLIGWGISSLVEWYRGQVLYDNYLNLTIFWIIVVFIILLRIYIALFRQINALISRFRKKRKENKLQQASVVQESENVNEIDEEQDIHIDPNTIMQTEHDYLWEKYGKANEVMMRGYNICLNTIQKDILIVGYNPPFYQEDEGDQHPYLLPENETINHLLVSSQTNLRYKAAYIDLFSFRESDHQIANKQVVLNPQLFGYVIEQVCLTQNMIEELIRPKLIIVLNQDSWAYFGKLPQYTWMGYKYENLLPMNGNEVCCIRGYTDKQDRISIEREQTNLKDTIVVFLNKDSKLPTPEELSELLK